jgi:hypothetical protein
MSELVRSLTPQLVPLQMVCSGEPLVADRAGEQISCDTQKRLGEAVEQEVGGSELSCY